jgi:hypothetical protein
LKLKLRRRLQAIREAWHQGREAWRQDILPWWHTPDKKPAGRQLRELWVAWRTYRRIPGQYFRYCAYCWDIDDPQAYLPRLLIAKTQKALNSRADRRLTLDKQRFRVAMEAAGLPAVRELFTIGLDGMITDAMDCALTRTEAEARIADYGKDLFVKPVDGAFGIDASILALGSGTQALFDGRAWIVQPRLVQHSVLSKIYPGAINTIRIDTLVTGDQVEFGSAILRIGLGGRVVDNGRAGGLSAAVDIETGRICRPALREPLFDPARTPYDRHPDTGEPILGVELPFWADLRGLVSTAAQSCGKLRTIGWDVVFAPDGPILLEANQYWDADLTQMHWPMRDTPLGREAVAYLRAGRVPSSPRKPSGAGQTGSRRTGPERIPVPR